MVHGSQNRGSWASWGPKIIFSEKKSLYLNNLSLDHNDFLKTCAMHVCKFSGLCIVNSGNMFMNAKFKIFITLLAIDKLTLFHDCTAGKQERVNHLYHLNDKKLIQTNCKNLICAVVCEEE